MDARSLQRAQQRRRAGEIVGTKDSDNEPKINSRFWPAQLQQTNEFPSSDSETHPLMVGLE